jgi:hypothetical protein
MSDPIDTEWLALAHEQAHEIMKCCDELIQRTERELSKFTPRSRKQRTRITTVGGHLAGRFSFVSLGEPSPLRRLASNSD